MKHIFFLIVFCFGLFSVFAQHTLFANIYDINYGNEIGGYILIVPDGYILMNLGRYKDIENGITCDYLIKFDKLENLIQ